MIFPWPALHSLHFKNVDFQFLHCSCLVLYHRSWAGWHAWARFSPKLKTHLLFWGSPLKVVHTSAHWCHIQMIPLHFPMKASVLSLNTYLWSYARHVGSCVSLRWFTFSQELVEFFKHTTSREGNNGWWFSPTKLINWCLWFYFFFILAADWLQFVDAWML